MSDLVINQSVLPDISKPKWDQSTYLGRVKYFFSCTNPMTLFASTAQQEKCREIVTNYKKGVMDPKLTVDELWDAKILYDATYHPDTGEKMFVVGRMSSQVPRNMILTGILLGCYRTSPGIIFSHWLNQSSNAIVNYTNRSGNSKATNQQLFFSYCCATGGAMAFAVGMNKMVKNSHGLAGRFVPFIAVAIANAINIPMMRYNELSDGMELKDENDQLVGTSKKLAATSITQVTISRILMAMPYMMMAPIIMNRISHTAFYRARPLMQKYSEVPIQTILAGIGLYFSTPLCCALYPQRNQIEVASLEESTQREILSRPNPPKFVYFNKGL